MRCFIALEIPQDIKERIYSFSQKFEDLGKIRRVESHNLHFTLKFFGEITEDKVKRIIEKMEEIEKKPFGVLLKGIGVFPSPSYIRVIWVGVSAGGNEMQNIAKIFSEKDLVPHLTIARVKILKEKEKIKKILEEEKETEFGKFTAEKITLFESRLTPKGPKYTKIYEISCKSSE